MQPIQILISIPRKIFGKTLWVSQYRRALPRAWTHIHDGRRRSLYIRYLSVLPFDTAVVSIAKDLLNLKPAGLFWHINPDDIAIIAESLSWMKLIPSSIPIIPSFSHKSQVYSLPRPDFLGGTAFEYATAEGYYTEWIETPDDPTPLLCLVATLCRIQNETQLIKTGDARQPLSMHPETEIEARAKSFDDIDFAYIVAVLRYFEGVKAKIHKMGVASGIFEMPKKDDEGNILPQKKAIGFGWWTAFRTVAKGQNKTEEQVWEMSMWRVLSIMIEEKQRFDEQEKQMKTPTE